MCELHRSPTAEQDVGFRGVVDFIEELVVALTNARIYGIKHQRVQSSLASLMGDLRLITGESGAALTIGSADGFLFYDGQPLMGASLAAPRIIQPLKSLQSGGIQVQPNATLDELGVVAEYLGKQKRAESDYRSANFLLQSKGCRAIEFLPPYQRGDGPGQHPDMLVQPVSRSASRVHDDESSFATDIPVHLYQCIVDHLQEMMVGIYGGHSIQFDQTRHFIEQVLAKLNATPRSMLSICRYEQYDAYTFGHSIRVCSLALNFARSLTDNSDLLQRIGVAALVHDVGKAWVPFDILHSTSRLSEAARLEMNKHTTYGAQILIEMGQADPMSVAAAFGHHLSGEGRGYPQTLGRFQLSTATKIVKLCDVYEALTAVRPYKDRMSPLRAYRIMMSMRDYFDPALLRKFISVNGLYPIGSRVRLNTGELGHVDRQSDRFDAPVIEIDATADGATISPAARQVVDMSTEGREKGLHIEKILLEAEMG